MRRQPIKFSCLDWFMILVTALLVTLLLTPLPAEPAPPIGWTTPAKVVRVIDGDTIEVAITRKINVRLDNCWAPESRTRDDFEKLHGLAAKAYLSELLDAQSVILQIPASETGSISDVFTLSRVVGTIWLTDPHQAESVNATLIRTGYCWPTKAEQIEAIEARRSNVSRLNPAKEGQTHASDHRPGQPAARP